jgi:hypothetical protein
MSLLTPRLCWCAIAAGLLLTAGCTTTDFHATMPDKTEVDAHGKSLWFQRAITCAMTAKQCAAAPAVSNCAPSYTLKCSEETNDTSGGPAAIGSAVGAGIGSFQKAAVAVP